MIALRAVADTLLASVVFLAILGAGWMLSWPVARAARSVSHRTGFHDRSTAATATARWTVRLIAILAAFAAVGIAAIAVLQLLLVGAVAAAAIAGGIAFGFAGRERARDAMGIRKSAPRRAKPLPQLGRQFESMPEPAAAVMYGMPAGDWTERAQGDRRAPKPRFDWGLIERRAGEDRRSFS